MFLENTVTTIQILKYICNNLNVTKYEQCSCSDHLNCDVYTWSWSNQVWKNMSGYPNPLGTEWISNQVQPEN